ncbi:hypothetical protein EVAR_46908_1 [Eumeta japonica]|uniref:Uncharacterized protein n=1 Tax=Eumeta variegata TaxID=151549 RepID=A0A4C1XY91_EUMVA|nr:hypothetical protein EVAR_46908_1 [Eumeta japonica]
MVVNYIPRRAGCLPDFGGSGIICPEIGRRGNLSKIILADVNLNLPLFRLRNHGIVGNDQNIPITPLAVHLADRQTAPNLHSNRPPSVASLAWKSGLGCIPTSIFHSYRPSPQNTSSLLTPTSVRTVSRIGNGARIRIEKETGTKIDNGTRIENDCGDKIRTKCNWDRGRKRERDFNWH